MATTTTEQHFAHVGESAGCADHDHDLVHELSKRLDSLWRYNQYLANAEGHAGLQNLWRDFKEQEQKNIQRIKTCIAEEVKKGCF